MKWNDVGFANLKQSMYKIYDKTKFQVYNPGIEIHPFEQELKIKISDVVTEGKSVEENYHRYEGSIVEEPNHYTTTQGTKVYFSFRGNKLYFYHFADDRGGIWEYRIDGKISGRISTHIDAVPNSDLVAPSLGRQLLAEGLEDKEHEVILEFKGADPKNVVDNPRGWVRHTDDNYKTFEYYSGSFELENKTTSDIFIVYDAITRTDEIILDGINVTKNGLQYFRKTNKKYITLNPGWNEFEITGANRATIEFDYPFYYL